MELNSILGVVLDTEEDAVEVARCKLLENECDDFETTSVIERVKEFVNCFVFDLTDEGITKLDKFLNGARERFDNGEPDVAFVFEKLAMVIWNYCLMSLKMIFSMHFFSSKWGRTICIFHICIILRCLW